MNLLKGILLTKSANFLSPTRWSGKNTLQLLVSDIKYLSSNESLVRLISLNPLSIGGEFSQTNQIRARSYSRGRFEKISNYFGDKKIQFQLFNNRRKLAYFIYRTIDTINFQEFYEFLELPDTFYSWFVLLELHIWMLMCKIMDDQASSLKLRNILVELLWCDVEERCRNLGPVQKKIVKKQLAELYDRLPITLLIYDEGLQSTDTVLAAALWYKVFEKKCDDPIKLEVLVRYIRHQVERLSTFELKDLAEAEKLTNVWMPFSEHVKAVSAL